MRRRKKGRQAHSGGSGHERWLVSYADFITLLFAFFTALYAISNVDKSKAVMVALSTRAAFHNSDLEETKERLTGFGEPAALTVPAKLIGEVLQPYSSEELRELFNTMKHLSEEPTFKTFVNVRRDERGLVVSLGAEGFFESGAAEIKENYVGVLEVFAEKLVKSGYPLRAEGHTDDIPINSARYRNNWELSTSRAVSVLQYLIEVYGYPSHMLSVAGYGSTHPIADNVDEYSRARNRRVDLVLVVDEEF